jgi:hypothetical protein
VRFKVVRSIDQQTTIKKALSAKAIEKMKVGDPDKADIGEYVGLRVHCGKTGMKTFSIVIVVLWMIRSNNIRSELSLKLHWRKQG